MSSSEGGNKITAGQSDIVYKTDHVVATNAVSGPNIGRTLIHKQLETQGCVLNIVATDALVLMHQTMSIHSAD